MWVKLYHQHPIACVAAVYIQFMLIIYKILHKQFVIIYQVEVGSGYVQSYRSITRIEDTK